LPQFLVHDGLAFSFEGPRALLEPLTELAERDGPRERAATEPTLARIHCRLQLVPLPVPRPTQPAELGWLRWEWVRDEASIWTRCARASIRRAGFGDLAVPRSMLGLPSEADPSPLFTADVWLPADPHAVQTLMGGLCSAVLHAIGGAIVHASSVQLDGGVIAFLGPSGAGKSTASRLLGEGALFSVDRLAVAPIAVAAPEPGIGDRAQRRHSWWAYPLFGGTWIEATMPRALPAWAPLRALFGVHQMRGDAFIETCSPIRALATLRESGLHGGQGAGMELEFLSRLQQLAAETPIARLHFGLGASLAPLIRRWLSEVAAPT